jgi:hypothetical protein
LLVPAAPIQAALAATFAATVAALEALRISSTYASLGADPCEQGWPLHREAFEILLVLLAL